MSELPGYHDQSKPELLVATAAEWNELLAENERLQLRISMLEQTTHGFSHKAIAEAIYVGPKPTSVCETNSEGPR